MVYDLDAKNFATITFFRKNTENNKHFANLFFASKQVFTVFNLKFKFR